VEAALNMAWSAMDKLREAEHLSEDNQDRTWLKAKSLQVLLFLQVFKNVKKAKKIYKTLKESSASERFADDNLFLKAQLKLQQLDNEEPEVIMRRYREEIVKDLDEINKKAKEAKKDVQSFINFVYQTYPPISRKDGAVRPKPNVSKIGEDKAIKKVIISYHPDKIKDSDKKYALICEEITKVFTEMRLQ